MYISTRGKEIVSASMAIIKGLACDGGLFMPVDMPKIDINKYLDLDYKEVARRILLLFLDDFSEDEIDYAINGAYSEINFPKGIISYDHLDNMSILNLYNGPTFAFKDMALTILPFLLEVAKKKNNNRKKSIILTATSGDTGSAALSGFKQINDNNVIVLYPYNAISEIQELQMLSFKDKNTWPIAVRGNFDDCQRIVKEIFSMGSLEGSEFSSANSINIGRLIPQVVYYVYSYIELVRCGRIKLGEKLNVCVPTGNFGNILACYIAKMCGVDIGKIICASNSNNVLTEFFESGVYNANREFMVTNSPSMDILISSNLERYISLITKDSNYVGELFKELKDSGSFKLMDKYFNKMDIMGLSIGEDETISVINDMFVKNGVLIDPHTAVAYGAYLKSGVSGYTLVVSTASPYKFNESVSKALDVKYDGVFNTIKAIEDKSAVLCDERIKMLGDYLSNREVWDKDEVIPNIYKIVGDILC